eukprot:Hpha_TRINITY_DN15766_c0_g1::TRINITY_DN15766_c0_g1_i1::g.36287::m.36287/K04798/pfdB, PFDN6; prefoldin beta subunit
MAQQPQQQQAINPLPPDRQKFYQNRMNAAMQELRDLQQKLQKLLTQQRTLQSQAQENEMVQNELKIVDDGAQVYKLIGPVLVSQEPEDAMTVVTRRLEYINGELKGVEKGIDEVNKTHLKTKDTINTIQQEFQQEAQQVLARAAQAAGASA